MSNDLRQALREAMEELERIGESPLLPGMVLDVLPSTLSVATGVGSNLVIQRPQKGGFKKGDHVLLNKETFAYIRHSEFSKTSTAGMVTSIIDFINEQPVVEVNGDRQMITSAIADLEIGDRVRVVNAMVVEKLPNVKSSNDNETLVKQVSWDDIGGNAEAKEALQEAIENPVKFKELYEHYGAKAPAGILFAGPPGCGKTMLGQAAATAIGSADGFIYCKGPDVLNAYVGESEANIRRLFTQARGYMNRTGKRAIIFIDEADAILGSRGNRNASVVTQTVVPQFLAEMDGLEESPATVIISTNRPFDLDPAIVREGRFDRKINVARPNQAEAADILERHLKKAPTTEDIGQMSVAIMSAAFTQTFSYRGRLENFSSHVSGAVIAGIVAKAKVIAMRRDIKNSTKTGIVLEDLTSALAQTLIEMGNAALEESN